MRCGCPPPFDSQKTYNERQTELCDKVHVHLQSIAIQAVKAQSEDPSGDSIYDYLGDISDDVTKVLDWCEQLRKGAF